MQEYIFIHGKNASLSEYELRCIFGEGVVFQQQAFSLVRTDRPVNQQLMNRLGGTIKIGEVFTKDPVDIIFESAKTEKIEFALSQYGGQEQLSKTLIGLKKKLRLQGRNARFVNKNFENISSGQLNQTKLLEKGVDLTRCFMKGNWVWSRTIAFQDIDAYSLRDYEKPHRDMQVGMMPPKLAQMMINFARPTGATMIYDPFCGLGTILIEGALRGNPVMGSDIKSRLVQSTLENIQWTLKKFQLSPQHPLLDTHFFSHDATLPFPKDRFPDDLVVVSEGYLGPVLNRFPDQQKQKEIFDLLHSINSKFFLSISQIIRKGNRISFCFPFFRLRKERVFYPENFVQQYLSAGFKLLHSRHQLIYERENQVVGREIVVLERQ